MQIIGNETKGVFMKINILLMFIILMIFCTSESYASTTTWNFLQRVGWTDYNLSDSDEYGNADVWFYKYSTGHYSNSATYYEMNTKNFASYHGWSLNNNYPCAYDRSGYFEMSPNNYQDVVLEFRSPVAATFNISLLFTAHSKSTGFNAYIQKNDTVLSSFINIIGTHTFNISNIDLAEGDSLYFRIDSINDQYYDLIRIENYTLTGVYTEQVEEDQVVPEPASVGLVLLSVGGLVYRGRKRA